MKLGNSFTRVLSKFYQFPEPFLDRREVKLLSYFISTAFDYLLTLERTHKVILPPWYNHTPPWYKGGGRGGGVGGVDRTPPIYFWYVKVYQYFENVLLSSERLWSSRQDKLYFTGSGAAWYLWRHQGRLLGRHLGFCQELETRLKQRELVIFCAWQVK